MLKLTMKMKNKRTLLTGFSPLILALALSAQPSTWNKRVGDVSISAGYVQLTQAGH